MSKKEALSNSFGSTSRRRKASLSDEVINQIAENREIQKKATSEKVEKPKPVPTKKASSKPENTKKAKPKAVQKKLKRVVQADDEEVIKTSLDMPVSLYEDMKISLIRQKRSMREYLIDLIQKDLAKRNK